MTFYPAKQSIYDVITHAALRDCSTCRDWYPLSEFFMHGRHLSNLCKPCERARARGRHANNRERSRANTRAWIAAHTEQHREGLRRWRAANRERLREYDRSPQKRARGREYMRQQRLAGTAQEYQREYNRRTGKGAEKASRRRAQMLGVEYEQVDRNAIIKRDGRLCYLCGIKVKWREVTLDHVIPLARGGAHTANNLRVACGPCNYRKQHRLLDEYQAYLLTLDTLVQPHVTVNLPLL